MPRAFGLSAPSTMPGPWPMKMLDGAERVSPFVGEAAEDLEEVAELGGGGDGERVERAGLAGQVGDLGRAELDRERDAADLDDLVERLRRRVQADRRAAARLEAAGGMLATSPEN